MALRKRKAAAADAESRFTPKRARNALAVAKIVGPAVIPVVAPHVLRALGEVRDRYDRGRARRLGVPVEEIARFSGRGGALHARISGAAEAIAELRERPGATADDKAFADRGAGPSGRRSGCRRPGARPRTGPRRPSWTSSRNASCTAWASDLQNPNISLSFRPPRPANLGHMGNRVITAALTAGLLLGGAATASAQTDPSEPVTITLSAEQVKNLCEKRLPKIEKRAGRLLDRINGGPEVRGSVEWLRARAAKERDAGRETTAELLEERADRRAGRVDDLTKVKQWVTDFRTDHCGAK
jgi:hypothetical protein